MDTKSIRGSFLQRVLGISISKKIIVDQNLGDLIPELKKVGISHIWDISKLKLAPNQSSKDEDIELRLRKEGKKTPNSQFLFITNNEKDFSNPKGFDVLVVSQVSNGNLVATIKSWLTTSIIKESQNKVFRAYKTSGKGDYGYVILEKKQ